MYRAVLEREPGHLGGPGGLSHARLNQGDLEEAVALARQVISLAPGRREACEAHYTIGYAAARDQRLDRGAAGLRAGPSGGHDLCQGAPRPG